MKTFEGQTNLLYSTTEMKSILDLTVDITGSFLTLQFHVERKIKNNTTINSIDLFLFEYPALQFVTKNTKNKSMLKKKNILTENACGN